VLDDGQAVVAALGDRAPGLAHARVGADGDRVLGHEVGHGHCGRLAQAVLEVPQRLEEHHAAEQLDVVRDVEVAPLVVGDDEVLLGHDPDTATAVVDHRQARQLVLAHARDDRLHAVVRHDGHGVGVHDVAHDEGHGVGSLDDHRRSASITSRAMTPSAPRCAAARTPA
jgi:hypothetical protein